MNHDGAFGMRLRPWPTGRWKLHRDPRHAIQDTRAQDNLPIALQFRSTWLARCSPRQPSLKRVDCFAVPIAGQSWDPLARPDKRRRRVMTPTNPFEWFAQFWKGEGINFVCCTTNVSHWIRSTASTFFPLCSSMQKFMNIENMKLKFWVALPKTDSNHRTKFFAFHFSLSQKPAQHLKNSLLLLIGVDLMASLMIPIRVCQEFVEQENLTNSKWKNPCRWILWQRCKQRWAHHFA